ncbi:related to RSN1-Overexpression rescues sro7/sop1 in NaCl [Serendipita indica DSM 11827]|uniref:Related to RSN1-Overexpression rescues sro7/sop1 in NaCl n=1 Tax=Serendipita indica (strain DSM 11827) TaxID=1109443 RepID=G4TSH2_SERID|nr:related to RSN1-Overexpression rescues sro7/sop1 in NaCl [Serendipita indica DSM 11827]
MAQDPYVLVQREIQTALDAAEQLRASYARIRSTARGDSEELVVAREELQDALSSLEADLDELEQSVAIVEQSGARMFGITERELITRRRYVSTTRDLLKTMKNEVTSLHSTVAKVHAPANGRSNARPQEDDQSEWARQEQQMLMQEQDRTLETISGTLNTLHLQAGLMGQEISEHNELLGDLENQVDRTESKLARAQKRMDYFLQKAEESRWSIYILIAILMFLVMSDIRDEAKGASTESFTAALIFNAAIFGAEILVFTLVRRRFKAIYEPRTYLTAEGKRQQPLSSSLLGWPLDIWRADHNDIRHHNGMDAFFFVRFLRMMARIFLPIWPLSWAVLMPIDAVSPNNGLTGLDQFTFGNVRSDHRARYAAHALLIWVCTAWILYNIKTEMRNFVTLRQRHLVDPIHSASAQANTILITGVPRKFLDEHAIAQLFAHLPGGVKKVWLNRDLKELPEVYERRLKASNKLESAEIALLKTGLNLNKKANGGNVVPDNHPTPDKEGKTVESATAHPVDTYVPHGERPTHRLPVLGFLPLGKKVDTIDWATKEIVETSDILTKGREQLEAEEGQKGEKYPPLNSVFVLFNQQIAAHLAAQALTHNEPYRMANKYTEVAPADVIWENLGMNPYEARIRQVLSYAATGALVIFWAIPVSFVGIVANVSSLCKYSWLAWVCKMPSSVLGIVQGILPPVALAVLMMLLPIVLRLFGKFEGIPRKTGIELSLMTRFFIFQVVHGFLITTISGSITNAIAQFSSNPTAIPGVLARNLPRSSTFFLTYAILQALSGTAGSLLQAVPLVVYYVKLFILGSTPRSVYSIKYDLRDVFFGTLFPSITLLVVISFGYMIISPIINGLALVAFGLFYFVWKYLFLWQLDQPASGDTGGLFFPKAIQHMFVGLYIQQICLAALFFIAPGGKGAGGSTIALLLLTAFFHAILNNSYGPLVHSLPLTLAHKSYGMPQTGEVDEEIGGNENEDDFDNDAPSDEKTGKKMVPPADGTDQDRAAAATAHSSHIQHNQGPGPSAEYGTSVPVEGKRNEGPTDFNHPCLEPQRVVWIPQDPLGVGELESRHLNEQGVEASTENATMDERGKVDIQGHPPGMDPSTIFA